ncbi:Phosphatidylinositol 3-kinase catalytic subunit type 3 [Trichinella patagoniensis]|uniref:Phosphatidylinositol 3-kinase catalytic subunit type 3 n=1 Tax=Trichinella patagoniensis TaxID=990121 RepID=A0A0V1A868_9BILA|nr:Phosphatidylinositol 3-kinase catalytic subunit type 3 [Trichinella patagoniensis]
MKLYLIVIKLPYYYAQRCLIFYLAFSCCHEFSRLLSFINLRYYNCLKFMLHLLMAPNTMSSDRINYVYSCDVHKPVKFKIGCLEGLLPRFSLNDILRDPNTVDCLALQEECQPNIYVECQLYCLGRPVGLPIVTSSKYFTTFYCWDEWITLPIKYSELSRDAQLAFTVVDVHSNMKRHVIGGTSITLFSKRGILRRRQYDLKVWPFQSGDGTLANRTPGKMKVGAGCCSETVRLMKRSKRYFSGLMEKVDWLDRITFRQIERICAQEKSLGKDLFLLVDFPVFHFGGNDFCMVYFETDMDNSKLFNRCPALTRFVDLSLDLENVCELKNYLLARSTRSVMADRDIKPNPTTRDQLARVVNYPPNCELNNEDKALIWKFRHYLKSNGRALVKFLQCVQWQSPAELAQAEELLHEWAPMSVADTLELLSSKFQQPLVREYAVGRIRDSSPDVVHTYLMQLVQALKFEEQERIRAGTDPTFVQNIQNQAPLQSNRTTGDDGPAPQSCSNGTTASVERSSEPPSDKETYSGVGCTQSEQSHPETDGTDLASFLIRVACKDPTLANHLYWHLKTERDCLHLEIISRESGGKASDKGSPATDEKQQQLEWKLRAYRKLYSTMVDRLLKALARGGTEAKRRRKLIKRQEQFVAHLLDIMGRVMRDSGPRNQKLAHLKKLLAAEDDRFNLHNMGGLPLPLDPGVKLQSIVAEKATMFNSAMSPAKLTFKTIDGEEYTTIFKYGDDLRQDQLVLQTISLMDELLRRENLDLKLTPYKVIATGSSHGFVQFKESITLREVVHRYGTIQEFLRCQKPATEDALYGVHPEIMDNYVRSCAGYSVITFLLGVGDRHLHNLMLCKNGCLFHIDFGYILGRDPKPLPPPIKLTKEMVEAMGGLRSIYWREFVKFMYTAFLLLRRHVNLFVNIFALMVQSSLPDIASEPEKAVSKLQDRFFLRLSDEEAVYHLQHMIEVSINAKMAAIVDLMHDIAQFLRK